MRYAMKALFVFGLLERRRMAIADIAAHVDRVGIYRDFNALFLRMPAAHLAAWLVAELEKVGAIRREGGDVLPE